MDSWTAPSFPMRYPDRPTPLRPPGPMGPPEQDDSRLLSGLDPEVLQRLADAGVIDDEMLQNMLRQRQAETAASAVAPEGRQVGSVYTPASPLEHVASALGRMRGFREREEARGEHGTLVRRKRRDLYAPYELYGAPRPMDF